MEFTKSIKKLSFLNQKSTDFNFFCFGILFLASAPFISCIFLLYSLYKGALKSKNIFKDKYNQVLILVSIVLILKSIFNSFDQNQIYNLNRSLNWADLANWIPLFLCFLSLNNYLDNNVKREKVAKFFIAGTIPVLVSCIGQYWFDWYGPFEIFNGLIKWFQRPLSPTNQNVTGLFSNPNYTGAWLSMMWPLSIALITEKIYLKEFLKSKIMFLIMLILSTSLILTNSRNAWLSFCISIPIMFGGKSLRWFSPIIIFLFIAIFSSFLPFVPEEISRISQNLVPDNVQDKFSEIFINFQDYPRIDIWKKSIIFIINKPFFGWGAGSFPILYEMETGFYNSHTHNLFLELSINHGLLVSIPIISFFCLILFKSFNKIFIQNPKKSLIDKGWWTAAFIFFSTHLYDILIFDIRINLASWILIIGLRNILLENKNIAKDSF